MLNKKLSFFLRDCSQWSIALLIIGFLFLLPLLSIFSNLLGGFGEMWNHIYQHFLFEYIKNSLILVVGTSFLSLTFGVGAAWITSQYKLPFHAFLEFLLFLPLSIPSYIVAYCYVGLFDNGGTFINVFNLSALSIHKIDVMNINGLIWILSFSLYPYIYVSTKSFFNRIPSSLKESSLLLGVNKIKFFYKIALPLALPAIIGGLFLVVMEVFNDYGAAKYFNVNTFTTGIFRSWTMLEDLQSAVVLSAILVCLVFGLRFLSLKLRGRKSFNLINNNSDFSPTQHTKAELTGFKKVLCLLFISIPIIFGFILPIAQLIYWASMSLDTIDWTLLKISAESFFVALLTAFLTCTTAILLILFSRWNKLKFLNFIKSFSTVGYVVPGAIIGIGVISSSQFIINSFDQFLNLKVGYLFYGSVFILVYAYIFRFLAVAFNPIEANSLKIGKVYFESAYLLGKPKAKTFFKIELPILKFTIVSAFLMVFIDVLKELPLTLILKPYDLQTLAVHAYSYAEDERVSEAAMPSLILIFSIIFLFLIVNYFNNSNKKITNESS